MHHYEIIRPGLTRLLPLKSRRGPTYNPSISQAKLWSIISFVIKSFVQSILDIHKYDINVNSVKNLPSKC